MVCDGDVEDALMLVDAGTAAADGDDDKDDALMLADAGTEAAGVDFKDVDIEELA